MLASKMWRWITPRGRASGGDGSFVLRRARESVGSLVLRRTGKGGGSFTQGGAGKEVGPWHPGHGRGVGSWNMEEE